METWFAQFVGHPLVLAGLLFVAPFLLEEAAILSGAGIAAAGELSLPVTIGALYLGIVASDWLLYGLGAAAGRSERLRAWIGPDYIERGRRILHRGALGAGLMARLVPWLLFPVFVASGFLRVGFARFALVNAGIALVYVNVLFWSVYGLDLILFELFEQWGWVIVAAFAVGVVALSRIAARRQAAREAETPEGPPPGCR
ncbi:DedA family protein [Lutibaculum baratangense]|uniref:DedA family protein n=1 Tax=Lutibaculum baratangense TaxID=1358440 RepID=UPI00058FD1B6|nr:VTT domain-containing protein [Lutibaculum baratangense]